MEGEINAVLRVKNGKKPFGKEKIEIFLVFLTVQKEHQEKHLTAQKEGLKLAYLRKN